MSKNPPNIDEDWLKRPDSFLLRTSKVAQILDRSPGTVRLMAQRGQLQVFLDDSSPIPRTVYFTVGEIKRFLANEPTQGAAND